MTEAFEIGVSLALQDGVSDAIGQARRDVAALEHAVRESGVSLRSLREVGVRAASVAFGDQRREVVAGPVKPPAQAVAPRLAPEAAPRLEAEPPMRMDAPQLVAMEALPEVERVAPVALEAEAAPRVEKAAAPLVEAQTPPRVQTEVALAALGDERGSGAPAVSLGAVASPPAAAGAQAVSAPVAMRDDEPLARPLQEAWARAPVALAEPLAPPAVAAQAPVAVLGPLDAVGQAAAPRADVVDSASAVDAAVAATGPVAPAALARRDIAVEPHMRLADMRWPEQPVAPAASPPAVAGAATPAHQPEPLRGADERQTAAPMSLLSALRISGGAAPIVQSEESFAAVAADEASDYGSIERETVQPSAAPSAMATRSAPPADVAAPRGTEKNAPRPSEPRGGAPSEGDVFLDGMLVGRWMSRFLNREAERASAGPTGFDSRRGRLLPGVTVGG